MIKTIKLAYPEYYRFGGRLELVRDSVEVTQAGKTPDGRTVWVDTEDDGCFYTWENGTLWNYTGEIW